MMKAANAYRKKELGDHPDLHAKATPDYDIGCKRALFTNEWYPTLKRSNVELVHGDAPELLKLASLMARVESVRLM